MIRRLFELCFVFVLTVIVLIAPHYVFSKPTGYPNPPEPASLFRGSQISDLLDWYETTPSNPLLHIEPSGNTRAVKAASPPLALCFPVTVKPGGVHDGDTGKVIVSFELTVRYDDCWCPELKEKGGPEARDRAKQAEGKSGRLFIDMSNAHNLADLLTFGRVVGSIYLDGESESESQKQVRLKLASTKKGGELGK